MALRVDRRERALIAALAVAHEVVDLPVGDVAAKYEDGSEWILERKTPQDLSNSIVSGRWEDQVSRLHAGGFKHIFFVIEGDLRDTRHGLPYETLLSTVLNAELRPNSHVIRSSDVCETALIVEHLAKKCAHGQGIPSGNAPARHLTKRKKDAEPRVVFMRQLMTIPSISEHVSTKLVDHFGTLPELQRALQQPKTFPQIQLHDKTALGQARIQKLARHLL